MKNKSKDIIMSVRSFRSIAEHLVDLASWDTKSKYRVRSLISQPEIARVVRTAIPYDINWNFI